MRVLPFVLCVVSGLAFLRPVVALDRTTDLVDRVLAREQAVISGRFDYRQVKTSHRSSSDEIALDAKYRFDFLGDSWKLEEFAADSKGISEGGFTISNAETTVTTVNHKGSRVDLKVTTYVKEHGGVSNKVKKDPYARLQQPEPLGDMTERPPFFAGTLWHRCTADYIQHNRELARVAGSGVVDGVDVEVLEWDVPAADKYGAFYRSNAILNDGGTLRLYVAPSLGYALPKIEHVGRSGRVHATYVSHGFEEVADGIFFPKETKCLTNDASGGSGFEWAFRFDKIEDVNELIDEEDFIIDLPASTIVADLREPGRRGTVIRDAVKSDGVPDDVLALATGQNQFKSSASLWVIGLNLIIVAVCVWFMVANRRKLYRG